MYFLVFSTFTCNYLKCIDLFYLLCKKEFFNLCLDKSSISWHRDVYFYLKDDSVHFLNNFVCILIHVWGNVTKICLLFEQYYPSIQTKRKITIKITSFFVTRSQSSNMNSKLIFFNPSSKCGNSKTKDSLNTGFNVRFLTWVFFFAILWSLYSR